MSNTFGNTNRSFYITENTTVKIQPLKGENLMTIVCPFGGNMLINQYETDVPFFTMPLPVGSINIMSVPQGSFSISAPFGKIAVFMSSNLTGEK